MKSELRVDIGGQDPETEEAASKSMSGYDRTSARGPDRANLNTENHTRWQPVKNSRALVFAQTNDYGLNMSMHSQT